MVVICRESLATKTVFHYPNVAAYAVGKKLKKGFSENGLEISYDNNTLIPDEDVINGVVEGSLNPNKVIKAAINDLRNPAKAKDQTQVISATMTMNIITGSSKKPNVIVFVLGEKDDDELAKRREKFIIKFIKSVCKEFGIECMTDTKKIKKVFDDNLKPLLKSLPKKKVKKIKKLTKVASMTKDDKNYDKARVEKAFDKLKKYYRVAITRNVIKFTKSKKAIKYLPTRKTVKYVRRLITWYAVELHQIALSNKDASELSNKERIDLATTLANIFTRDNLKRMCEVTDKKKQRKKMVKLLQKKDGIAFKTYIGTRDALAKMDIDIPKAELGYPDKKKIKKKIKLLKKDAEKINKKMKGSKKKKTKKLNKKLKKISRKINKLKNINLDKPFMNPEKFSRKMSKYKLSQILQLVYMNIAYSQMTGQKFGTDEWLKGMKSRLTAAFGKDFYTRFSETIKAEDKKDAE